MQWNRLRIMRGADELVLPSPHSPWLMTVVMLLRASVMTWTYSCCWSTGHGAVIYRVVSPSRWRDEVGPCTRRQCHMCTFWGAPFANSCFETMHPIPSLRHSVLHTVGKGKTPMPKTRRSGRSRAIRRAGEDGVSPAVGSSWSRRCTDNLQAAPWVKPATICIGLLPSRCT